VLLREILIIYVAALFAVVLTPAVDRIASWRIGSFHASRPLAIALLILLVVLVLTVFLTAGIPPVVHDLHDFSSELPQQIPQKFERFETLPIARHFGLDALAERAESAASATAGYLVSALPGWLSHLFDILTAAFLCIYFMLEGDKAYAFFLSLFPRPQRERLDLTFQHANQKVSKWLAAQLLLMLILGASSTIVFALLHVRYFLLLGFLMGLFNIIPIAGGIFTIAIAAIVAALDSWSKMGAVLAFYLIYVNVENAYLVPRIMRSSVNLMGLTVLISLLLGTALAGVVGALVAVPTAAMIAVVLQEYAVHKDDPQ